MASMLVEVLKVDMDGQGFSCLEAAIGRHGVQVMRELNPDGGDLMIGVDIPPDLVA
jgi:hypothetical protein